MKIGIIGAENSHTAAIAKEINIDGQAKGFSVDYVWGETEEFAKAAAKAGKIPNIVSGTKDMLGKIDALIVDHRHAKYHLKAALPYVKAGIPAFIDKPFCYRVKEGKEFLETAKKNGAPVTSFSVMPKQKSFVNFCKKIGKLGNLAAATTYGPSDLKSPYGGLFFYGIHQIDMALVAFGYDVEKVLLNKNGNNAAALLYYKSGLIVTVNLIKEGSKGFYAGAMGENGAHSQEISFDKHPYLTGLKVFTKMFKTGVEPHTYDEFLIPVMVLEALQRSQKSGKVEKVV